jgi:hypothetical protein
MLNAQEIHAQHTPLLSLTADRPSAITFRIQSTDTAPRRSPQAAHGTQPVICT